MNAKKYVEIFKTIHVNILEFLDKEDNLEENYQNIINIFENQRIRENLHDIKLIFSLLLNISNNHHRSIDFFSKIEKIFLYINEINTNVKPLNYPPNLFIQLDRVMNTEMMSSKYVTINNTIIFCDKFYKFVGVFVYNDNHYHSIIKIENEFF